MLVCVCLLVFVCVFVYRFVLIPGDQCDDSSDEVQALLKKSSHACTGHEEDSGFRPVHVSCWVWLGPVWMGKDYNMYVFLSVAERGTDGVSGYTYNRSFSRAGWHCSFCVASLSLQDVNFVSYCLAVRRKTGCTHP